jgi:hypothetical protein
MKKQGDERKVLGYGRLKELNNKWYAYILTRLLF